MFKGSLHVLGYLIEDNLVWGYYNHQKSTYFAAFLFVNFQAEKQRLYLLDF